MNSIDLNTVYSVYSKINLKWLIELTCEPLYFGDFSTYLFKHLEKCWDSNFLADQVVTDLEQKSVVIYEFKKEGSFEEFFEAVKGFNEHLYVTAYSPNKGKIYDSWEHFTFIKD